MVKCKEQIKQTKDRTQGEHEEAVRAILVAEDGSLLVVMEKLQEKKLTYMNRQHAVKGFNKKKKISKRLMQTASKGL